MGNRFGFECGRAFFVTEAPTLDEAMRLVREIKHLCGRKD
jgi:hypothetical protein